MRTFTILTSAALILGCAAVNGFAAGNKADPVATIIQWVHAYYKSDAEKYWEIVSMFESPHVGSLEETREWMKKRLEPEEIVLPVNGEYLYGKARIVKEIVGLIDSRVDEIGISTAKMIIITANITRLYEFTDKDLKGRRVEELAVLKLYVVVDKDAFISYHADEINLYLRFPEIN